MRLPVAGLAAILVAAGDDGERALALTSPACTKRPAQRAPSVGVETHSGLKVGGSAGRQVMLTHACAHSRECEAGPAFPKRKAKCMQAQEAVMSADCASSQAFWHARRACGQQAPATW